MSNVSSDLCLKQYTPLPLHLVDIFFLLVFERLLLSNRVEIFIDVQRYWLKTTIVFTLATLFSFYSYWIPKSYENFVNVNKEDNEKFHLPAIFQLYYLFI